MSDTGGLLENEEVEFLLGTDTSRAAPGKSEPDAPQREVTMRGDLDQINLSDIFQTLAMSKMEGLLCVSNPVEQREVYFRDGYVRCMSPFRQETLRLGQRLIRARLLNAEQLRSALLEQKHSGEPLGKILVESEAVTQEDLDDILLNQLQEDLYALFTWTRGSFEFYRGEVANAATRQRLENTPDFETSGVLLEVARRADEWKRIFETVRSLDEIFESPWDELPENLPEDQRIVLEAVDGKMNVRDLADATLLGLFDCSRTVRELVEQNMLIPVPFDRGLDAAEAHLADSQPKLATIAIHTLLDRGEEIDNVQRVRAAELLERCSEPRSASRLLLHAARRSRSIDEAIELARRSRSLDRRSIDALRFLAEILTQEEQIDRNELATVLTDLADGLAEADLGEEALLELDRLESLGTDVPGARTRKARVLAKMGRTDDAVETLLGLAEHFKVTREKERLEQVYEQVLKVDYRRRDVARALRHLRESALARRGRMVLIGVAVVGFGFCAWLPIESWMRDRKVSEVETQVTAALEKGDLAEAGKLLALASTSIGEHDRLDALRTRLDAANDAIVQARTAELNALKNRMAAEAAEHLHDGRVKEALGTWNEMMQTGIDRDTVESLARREFVTLQGKLTVLVRELPAKLPPAPSVRQTTTEQEATLAQLRRDIETPMRDIVRGLVAARSEARLESILGRQFGEFSDVLRRAAAVYDRADALATQYKERRSTERIATELTPLYHEALEHERKNEFRAALEAYETLSRNHPADDDLKAHFLERVERYASILRFLELIEQATGNGDFTTAQAQLRALKAQYPRIPFDAHARLPVRVQTTPPGADVYVDGELVGQSPFDAAYCPHGQTEIRVERDGFHPEATTLTGDTVGLVRSLLARKADWTWQSPGSIDRAFVADGRTVYVTDRAGVASAVDLAARRTVWSHTTGDLSGLLSRPVLIDEKRLAFTSVDGTLRCLDRQDGKPLWTLDDLPAEAGPVAYGNLLVVATDDGRIVATDVDTATVRWTVPVPGAVQADLVMMPGGVVLAVTTQGTAHAVRVRDGVVKWESPVGRGVVAKPALSSDHVVIVADDGSISVLDPATGKERWKQRLTLGLVLEPAIDAGRVFVAEGRSIHVFDLSNGRRRTTFENDSEFRSALATAEDVLFAGDESGRVHALSVTDLEPRFLLRAGEPPLAPVTRLDDGTLLAAFGDRTLRVYAPRN